MQLLRYYVNLSVGVNTQAFVTLLENRPVHMVQFQICSIQKLIHTTLCMI